ncbi:MAG: 2Fe-2S iron-sulfur cluster-binding protein [Ignavibacteria bacterium]
MSIKLYDLKVAKKTFLNKEAVKIELEIPSSLKEIFEYKQGQFLSVQISIDGKDYRREYSLCSSPHSENTYEIASKNVKDGIVSNYFFNNLKEGDTILSYPPQGKFFTELNPRNKKNYVMIAGGSGITPVISIIKSVLYAEPESHVILYYGNNSEDVIMFKDELDELQNKYSDRFKLNHTVMESGAEWNGMKGFINTADLDKILIDTDNKVQLEKEFFICGPGEMMELVKNHLIEKNYPKEKIHIEYFDAPVSPNPVALSEDTEEVNEENIKDRKIKVILNDSEHEVFVPEGSVILDAVIAQDLDPPFSCRSGICTTCRAKLYSGKVKMDEREGLSDSEIDDGYILTCQSHPLTDDVKLEYM